MVLSIHTGVTAFTSPWYACMVTDVTEISWVIGVRVEVRVRVRVRSWVMVELPSGGVGVGVGPELADTHEPPWS